jgi:hypothetical protein
VFFLGQVIGNIWKRYPGDLIESRVLRMEITFSRIEVEMYMWDSGSGRKLRSQQKQDLQAMYALTLDQALAKLCHIHKSCQCMTIT